MGAYVDDVSVAMDISNETGATSGGGTTVFGNSGIMDTGFLSLAPQGVPVWLLLIGGAIAVIIVLKVTK
jgi:hypothetical protein